MQRVFEKPKWSKTHSVETGKNWQEEGTPSDQHTTDTLLESIASFLSSPKIKRASIRGQAYTGA